MKIFLVNLLFLVFVQTSLAQYSSKLKEKDKPFDLNSYYRKQLSLDTANSKKQKINLAAFDTIIITDNRFTSSSIGFVTARFKETHSDSTGTPSKTGYIKSLKDNYIKNLCFKNSGLTDIYTYIKSVTSISPGTEKFSLLIVVKNLWLSDKIDFIGKQAYEIGEEEFTTSGVIGSFEFYAKKSSNYWPLFRFEKTLSGNLPLSKHASEYIQSFIDSSLIKLSEISIDETVKNRKTLTWQQIDEYNRRRFSLPILNDTTHKKGVYRDYTEFKNNTPYYKDFTISKTKIADVLSIKGPNGTEEVIRKAWGYCDGEKIFIRIDNNYFELVRTDNTFFVRITASEIHANQTTGGAHTLPNGATIPTPVFNYNSITSQYLPYCLNMDTGIIY